MTMAGMVMPSCSNDRRLSNDKQPLSFPHRPASLTIFAKLPNYRDISNHQLVALPAQIRKRGVRATAGDRGDRRRRLSCQRDYSATAGAFSIQEDHLH
jgi:hypothetical protein